MGFNLLAWRVFITDKEFRQSRQWLGLICLVEHQGRLVGIFGGTKDQIRSARRQVFGEQATRGFFVFLNNLLLANSQLKNGRRASHNVFLTQAHYSASYLQKCSKILEVKEVFGLEIICVIVLKIGPDLM